MKRKDQWFRVSYDVDRRNELQIKKEFSIEPKTEIYNKEGRIVESWADLSSGETNTVIITLIVSGDGQKYGIDDNKGDIIYYLKESAEKSKTERDKALNEAHSHFLKEKKPGLITKEQVYGNSNEIKLTLKGEPNNFFVELVPNNVEGGMKQVKNENIKVKVEFILANKVTPEEVMNNFLSSQKSSWGWGKIILVVVLAIALLLIIIFWKKIWRWIKGESKQEKKVREQIDIF